MQQQPQEPAVQVEPEVEPLVIADPVQLAPADLLKTYDVALEQLRRERDEAERAAGAAQARANQVSAELIKLARQRRDLERQVQRPLCK